MHTTPRDAKSEHDQDAPDPSRALPRRLNRTLMSAGRPNPGLTPMMLNHAAWVTPGRDVVQAMTRLCVDVRKCCESRDLQKTSP